MGGLICRGNSVVDFPLTAFTNSRVFFRLDDANLLPGVGNLEDYLEWFATEETVQGVFVSYLKVSDPKSPTSQLLLGPEFDLQALEKSIISFSYVKDERVKSVGSRCNRDSCSLSLRIEDGSFTLFDMSSGWTKDDLEDYNTDEEPALRGVRGILVGVYEETATFFPSHKTAPFADLRQKIGRDGIPLTEDRKYKLEAVFFAVQQRKK